MDIFCGMELLGIWHIYVEFILNCGDIWIDWNLTWKLVIAR